MQLTCTAQQNFRLRTSLVDFPCTWGQRPACVETLLGMNPTAGVDGSFWFFTTFIFWDFGYSKLSFGLLAKFAFWITYVPRITAFHCTSPFHDRISHFHNFTSLYCSAFSFLDDSFQIFGNFRSSLFFRRNFFTNQCFLPAICPPLVKGSEGWCKTQNSWIISWNIAETKSSCQFDVQMITYQGQWRGWWGLPARGQPPLRSCRHRSAGTSPPGRWRWWSVCSICLDHDHFAHVHVLAVVNKDLLSSLCSPWGTRLWRGRQQRCRHQRRWGRAVERWSWESWCRSGAWCWGARCNTSYKQLKL